MRSIYLLAVLFNIALGHGDHNHKHHKEDIPKKLRRGETVHKHKCIHDEYVKNFKLPEYEQEESPIEATQTHEKKLRREHKGNWQNIRILADYTNLNTNTVYGKFIQERLMPSAIAYLQSSLNVYPKDVISEIKGKRYCNSLRITNDQYKNGVKGYDLVLYVTERWGAGQSWMAFASACIQDKQTNRPVAGQIFFNSYDIAMMNLDDPDDSGWHGWISVAVHEMIHVLGFSSALYSSFIDPTTNQRLGADKVYALNDGRYWITTSLVVQQAQTYFNCSTATGAPIENDGGSGTAGSHWERVAFAPEGMTGQPFGNNHFSIFTFKFLESSGWYIPNYDYAQSFFWGQNDGCTVEQGQCPTTPTTEFCSNLDADWQCTTDYSSIAGCDNRDDMFNGCTYWTEWYGFACNFDGGTSAYLARYMGGYIGQDSRCWVTDLPSKIGFQGVGASCFKSSCANGQITFQVGTNSYTCTQSGQVINVSIGRVKQATVTCPDIDKFCIQEDACPKDCSGFGTCLGTTCQCWYGRTGADCSQKI